jgi:ferric-dicitrate binding protein FerR (iron transport regulator)
VSRGDGEPGDDHDVAELLKLAGPPPVLGEEHLARLRDAAHREWRRSLHRRRRRSAAIALGLSGLAAALAWVMVSPSLRRDRGEGAAAAVVDHVTGDVREVSPGTPTGGRPLGHDARLRPGAVIATAKGRASVAWHDGTRLRLDEGTRLVLAADSVALEAGALYVEADPRRSPPSRFVVATPLGSTRHVGTRYEVRLGSAGLRVRVREGAVQVERSRQVHAAAAGEELAVHQDGGVSRRPVPAYGGDWAWVTAAAPPFRLEGRSARALLDWAAAEGGWTLHFSDPSLADVAARAVLHGTVEGMSPQDALAAVLPTCGLDHRLDGGRLMVSRASRR